MSEQPLRRGVRVVGENAIYHLFAHLAEGGFAELWLADVENALPGSAVGHEAQIVVKFPKRASLTDYLCQEAQLLEILWQKLGSYVFTEPIALAHLWDRGDSREGSDVDTYFMAMEYFDQASLNRHYGMRSIPLPELSRILCALAPTLDAIHRLGGAHRDIKWNNIVIARSGRVALIDMNPQRSYLGNAYYLAPELLRYYLTDIGPKPSDKEIDLYALGVVLFRALTGIYPVNIASGRTDDYAAAYSNVQGGIDLIGKLTQTDITAEIIPVLVRALHPDPLQRYLTAQAMADALSEVVG